MKYDYYKEIRISGDYEIYDFMSIGAKGSIVKRARFEFVEAPNTYNLAFGDLIEEGDIDDYSISDNKDMAKILATIASIVKLFWRNIRIELLFSEVVPPNEHGYIEWLSEII